jgi:GrpB-like predicted nucleotidyltransferase (UPF0157 family)
MHRFDDTMLGLTYGQVRLVDSDPGWPARSTDSRPSCVARSGNGPSPVEHVGSSAVLGLVAKPILNLAVGLASTTDPDHVIPAIERLGC